MEHPETKAQSHSSFLLISQVNCFLPPRPLGGGGPHHFFFGHYDDCRPPTSVVLTADAPGTPLSVYCPCRELPRVQGRVPSQRPSVSARTLPFPRCQLVLQSHAQARSGFVHQGPFPLPSPCSLASSPKAWLSSRGSRRCRQSPEPKLMPETPALRLVCEENKPV